MNTIKNLYRELKVNWFYHVDRRIWGIVHSTQFTFVIDSTQLPQSPCTTMLTMEEAKDREALTKFLQLKSKELSGIYNIPADNFCGFVVYSHKNKLTRKVKNFRMGRDVWQV